MTTDATSITSLYASTSLDGGGFSPFAGIIIEPFEGTQFYVNYSNALRSPSIIESVSAFTSLPRAIRAWSSWATSTGT